MRKAILIMIACACMCACKTAQPAYVGHTDTLYVNKEVHDTLCKIQWKLDSIYRHDSIILYKEGETQVKEVYRDKYCYEVIHDTLWKIKYVADTTYRAKKDSIIIKEELTRFQKLKLDVFDFLVFILIVCLAILIIPIFTKNK